MDEAVVRFVHDVDPADLPAGVLERARWCLLDLVGVAAAGVGTPLSRIMRDHAARYLRSDRFRSRLLFDGRAVGPPGAALANAATIDSMDGHDGHDLCKGHAGAAILPAALAFLDAAPPYRRFDLASRSQATGADLLAALVVGYEVATRAGIALHATAVDYHSSGAWNALGAAAVGARVLGLAPAATGHALGIAEYHGPRAPMMAGIDHPSMVKDSSAWGAHAGVTAALLAADGFTGPPPGLLSGSGAAGAELWGDLGTRWRVTEQYFKPYPVCRWAHPAVQATIDLVVAHDVAAASVARIEVTTFDPATRLTTRQPRTTEQAQYSLVYPVAAAAVHRAVDPELVAHPDRADEQVRRLAEGMTVTESPELSAAFPAARLAEVSITLSDGRRLSSGPTTAAGDPGSPLTAAQLEAKFRAATTPLLGADAGARLLHTVRNIDGYPLPALLDGICAGSASGVPDGAGQAEPAQR